MATEAPTDVVPPGRAASRSATATRSTSATSCGAAVAGLDPGVAGGRLADVLAFALAGATLVWLALLVGRARRAGRAVGLGSVAVAAAMLFAFAGTSEESTALSFFQLLAGAAF